jgi:ABC-type multidrug transport system ATPase subunit
MPSTIVIVAYRTSSIALADEVIFIDSGKIVAHGTHRQLSQDVPGYARIVEAYADDAELRSAELRSAEERSAEEQSAEERSAEERGRA